VKRILLDQSFSLNIECAQKLPSLKNYVSSKLSFGMETYLSKTLSARRAIAIFRLNCTRSLPLLHLDGSKLCELCDAIVPDPWLHYLYFCNKLASEKLVLPERNCLDHLNNYEIFENNFLEKITELISSPRSTQLPSIPK